VSWIECVSMVEGFMVHGTDSWEQRVIKQLSTTRVKR
jgi:hypothetical protein